MLLTNGKPRILVFIGTLRSGGKERRLVELLTYLKAKDRFEILVVMTRNEIHYKEFFNLKIDYKIIERTWEKNDVTVFSKFYKICRRFDPHVIHTWGRMQTFYSIPAVIGQKKRLVNSQITGAPLRLKTFTVNRIIDLINFRFSAIVLANSKQGLESFKPPQRKQKIILNGINPARFENLPDSGEILRKYGISTLHTVVMIASFSPSKDYNLFINVARQVTSVRNDISFIGVGGCDKDDSVYQRMKTLSAGNEQIIFHRQIKDVEALVNACSIGVLFSTDGEGTSNSILEYMALGKPVIANNGGGTGELIRHGENGYLVTKETPEEIAEWIIDLIDDTKKSKTFGAVSKARVREEYSSERMGEAFETIYNEALASVSEKLDHSISPFKV